MSIPYGLLANGLIQGQLVPFFGSGASVAGRALDDKPWSPFDPDASPFPTSAQLAKYLAREMSLDVVDSSELHDLTAMATLYELQSGKAELWAVLDRIFERVESEAPIDLHKVVALLPAPTVVFTTNYDTLIEKALEEHRRKYVVVVENIKNTITDAPRNPMHPSALEFGNSVFVQTSKESGEKISLQPVPRNRIEIREYLLQGYYVVYKMHGSILSDRSLSRYLISEDDYLHFMSYGSAELLLPSAFSAYLKTRRFLFLGYSLRDWNFRLVLYGLRRASGAEKARSNAIQLAPTDVEKLLWDRKGVDIYPCDLCEFGKTLRTAVEQRLPRGLR